MEPKDKQNKGKSVSASISNIAIRFHADDEELEEVLQSNSEQNTSSDKQTQLVAESVEEESSSLSSSQLSTPTSAAGDSQSYLTRLSKRSSSLESGSPSEGGSGDAWRLFRDFRGRITKTVEEKLEEIKSDRLKGNRGRQRQRPKLGSKVENSSISDSEDLSEGSASVSLKAGEGSGSQPADSQKKEKIGDDQSMKSPDIPGNDSSLDNRLTAGSSSEKDDDQPSSSSSLDKPTTEGKKKAEKDKDEKQKGDKTEEVACKKDTTSNEDEKHDKNEEEKRTDNKSDEEAVKKEKKTRTRFFSERFTQSPDKKKLDVSMKFSTLKDEESEDELLSVVEYGTEAHEALGQPVDVKRTSLKTTSVVGSTLFTEGDSFNDTVINRFKSTIWEWKIAILIVILAVIHKYFQTSGYLLGFVTGVVLTIEIKKTIDWVQKVFYLKESGQDFSEQTVYGENVFPIFSYSHFIEPVDNPEKVVYEGWINEYSQEYSPDTYHISLTETVHIMLEGSQLRLSSPSTKIPKRANWNEPEHKKLFNRQRLFDISGCKVQLVPVGLIHKRIWSKKYPICITLLKMSRIGIRHRTKGKITIEDDAPWLDPDLDDKTPSPVDEMQNGNILTKDDEESISESKDIDAVTGSKPQETEVSQSQSQKVALPEDEEVDKIQVKSSEKSPDKESNNSAENDDEDDDEDFVRISPSLLHEFSIHLFARSDRQKEIWFRRLVAATSIQQSPPHSAQLQEEAVETSTTELPTGDSAIMETSLTSVAVEKEKKEEKEKKDEKPNVPLKESPRTIRREQEKKYLDYMNALSQKKVPKLPGSRDSNSKLSPSSAKPSVSTSEEGPSPCEEVMWVNAFSGRLLYDVLQNSFWLDKIQEKFQRKLSAIRLPVFIEGLVISNINFGQAVPLVQKASRPVLNEDGIWVDLEIVYEGCFSMTIDTKLNLMKLKKDLDSSSLNLSGSTSSLVTAPSTTGTVVESSAQQETGFSASQLQKSAVFDSDVEDSAESSSEEPDSTRATSILETTPSSPGGGSSGNKMLRMVDRIAASKYFQQVTDNKFIKRAMEGVSNTNIALVVEVKGLAGTLVLNFPPPPSDRLWYGFRGNPKLWISAQPKVGERMVTMLHITSLIEKRLCKEFQKILVLPNMDDLIIPVMNTDLPR